MHLHASGFLTATPSLLYMDRFPQRQQAFAATAVDTLLASIEAYYIKYGVLSSFQFFSCFNFHSFMTKIKKHVTVYAMGRFPPWKRSPLHAVINEFKNCRTYAASSFHFTICRIQWRDRRIPEGHGPPAERQWLHGRFRLARIRTGSGKISSGLRCQYDA